MSKIKVTLHYDEPEDESVHTSLKFTLPKKWTSGPSDKVRDFFVGEYNKKFPQNIMAKEDVHLQAKGGVDIPHDGVVSDFISSGADVYVVGGKGPTMADLEAKAAEEKKLQAEAKVKEASMLRCKNFNCSAKYNAEDNHAQACRHHASPPVFHETAKWWSCCPQKKAYDWETFQAIPGCQTGEHSDVDKTKLTMGGGDLREAAFGPNAPKKLETEATHAEIVEYLKNACVAVGVKGEAFDGARDALCGKHNVKDMDKGMGDVMADLAGALNKALGELAKEE